MTLSEFDPLVSRWFEGHFAAPSEPQSLGWPEIRRGQDLLITAPTGSGKTLAAFLICLDGLVRKARRGVLEDRTEVLYVSPLKALSNDVQKNLDVPLAEIGALAASEGLLFPAIRTAVRTGDTPAWDRQRMLKSPPHVLVTTPESFFILLTAEKSRRVLSTVSTVIVDEIHAVADDKRGSHLALSLARLDDLVEKNGQKRPQRIGLSATVKPIEEVAQFLSPDARIVDVGHRRAMELAVEVPRDELGAVATNEMWGEIYDRLAELIRQNRTTLVFVNTRRLSERVSHHLAERLGADVVLAHHGSLSRRLRLTAEERLKRGELRAVVATASLELGIDVGTVDLVCQMGSPRSIGVALQRVGRSGHWAGAMPKGRLFATTRDELLECAALVAAIRSGGLDRLEIPAAPLDILAQQLVAAVACEEWQEDELFDLVRSTYPYRNLDRADFDAVLDMLSEGVARARGRSGTHVHRDRVNGTVRGRRGARLAAITSAGAIPDNANYQVVAEPEGTVVGTVDEDFAVESMSGDVFLLGTTSWKIRRIESGRIRVEDAKGAAPTIPFWRGEAPGRTVELSAEVSSVREALTSGDVESAIRFLMAECGCDRRGAEQAVAYVRAGAGSLTALPTVRRVVAERFFDEAGGMQLVLHAPFGSRINRAWGLALRKRFCRTFNFELQAAATDNGIVLSLGEQHSFPLEVVFEFLNAVTVEDVLVQAVLDTPLFTARWRWNGQRSLVLLRFMGGRKVAPHIQRMRADDLLAAVFPDQAACAENLAGPIQIPDHPLVKETLANCLYEAMDLDGLKAILVALDRGEIERAAIDTAEPSPFSHEILNANPYAYLDDAPLEERRARAVQMRRSLPDSADGIGALDPAAIAQVAAESWPVARDPDELHDALMTLVFLPPVEAWGAYFESLVAAGRAAVLTVGEARFWVSAERAALARLVHPDGVTTPELVHLPSSRALPEDRDSAASEVLGGWLESSGPETSGALAAKLALPASVVDAALARLEAEGRILRGRFRAIEDVEWCNRRVLARIHRLTLGRLRRDVEPVSSGEFVRFLLRWQHVEPGTQLHGTDGLLQVIRQLQGYEIPAAAWESHVLRQRMTRYEPDLLDRLCLSGEVLWGRLSPHPAFERGDSASSRVRPTRVAPLTLWLREDTDWLIGASGALSAADASSLSHAARDVLRALTERGASFFADLQRGTGRLPTEVEDALWELVAAGLVTADGFENLRSLIDPKRRRGERALSPTRRGWGPLRQGFGSQGPDAKRVARSARPRHATGRWTLFRPSLLTPTLDPIEAFARQLLRRWGVAFRDLLARESLAPAWRELLIVFRRLEARGEVRGGRFVAGFVGEQFARPEAVDLLRAIRRSPSSSREIVLSSSDPMNLAGIVLPGPRTSSLGSQLLRLRDGIPVAAAHRPTALTPQAV